jgi:hypothetical protein
MKKSMFFLVAISLFTTSMLSAQLIPSVGLHGYLNERVDAINVAPADIELEGRSGWHAGADLRIGKKILYIQSGLHYYNTNSRVVDLRDVNLPQDLGKQNHVSLKIPLQAGLRLGLNGTAAIHLQGGPVATASIKEKLVSDLGGQRNLAFGVMSGVAVDFLRFNVHARYEWGLTQAFENQAGSADVLSVGLGIVF